MPSPRTLLLLGLACLAVAGGGVTAATWTGSANSAGSAVAVADVAPAAAPAGRAPAAPKPATQAARAAQATMWVAVPAANIWYRTGWVRRVDRLSLGPHPDLRRWVHSQSYRQRLALGTNLMTQARGGEPVVVLATRGPWAKVRVPHQHGNVYRTGIIGWVSRTQLSATPVPAAAAPPLPHVEGSLLQAARPFLRTPYVFGGMSAAGIDCSGLTYLAAQRVGIELPRDAADQSKVGHRVARKALRPGDLVFFGPGGRSSIHHVGIYAGRGWLLHAPHTGSQVRYSRLATFHDYWGARRLLPLR